MDWDCDIKLSEGIGEGARNSAVLDAIFNYDNT
jgi:hypothetical protein